MFGLPLLALGYAIAVSAPQPEPREATIKLVKALPSLGSLEKNELKVVEGLSESAAFGNFVRTDRKRARQERLQQSFGPVPLAKLGAGAILLAAGHALKKKENESGKDPKLKEKPKSKGCQKILATLRRLGRPAAALTGGGLAAWGATDVYSIWGKDRDDEEEFIKFREKSGTNRLEARRSRLVTIKSIQEAALRRSLEGLSLPSEIDPKKTKIEVTMTSSRHLWEGYGEEATVRFFNRDNRFLFSVQLEAVRILDEKGRTKNFFWSVNEGLQP